MRASIVRAAGVDLTTVVDALAQNGLRDAWVIANAAGDDLIFDPEPDCVIGILASDADHGEGGAEGLSNLDVMLRIGRAAERGLPTVVVCPPPLSTLQPASGVDVVPCALEDLNGLKLHFWAFFANVAGDDAGQRPDSDTPSFVGDQYSAELEQLTGSGFDYALAVEDLTARVLRAAGARTVSGLSLESARGEVDLAFIIAKDRPGIIVANVKAGDLNEEVLERTQHQVLNFALAAKAQLGVVIYHDRARREFTARVPIPMTIRISLSELIAALERKSLKQVIAEQTAQAIGRM